jgi:hypothetical protein
VSTYWSQQLSKVTAQLVDCVCAALAEKGAGPACFCGLVSGPTPAWDYCGECSGGNCGMGYVAVTSVFKYESFPDAVGFTACDRPLAVTLTVGALRCTPIPSEDGDLPDEMDHAESALGLFADMGALYDAIACCGLRDVVVGEWTAFPSAGGCGGGAWEVTVALDGN